MDLIDKLTTINATWIYLNEEQLFNDEELSQADYYKSNATKEQYVEYIFYLMIYKCKDNKRLQTLLEALNLNGEFELELLSDGREYQVKYNGEFIDYRLDLYNHSPMGFGTGGSSYKQLALAVLATATNDKEALRYYEDFKKDIETLSKYPKLKNITSIKEISKISQIDILHWLATQIFSNPVKRICKILDTNQKELAEILNVSDVTVNRWSSKSVEIPSQTKRTFDILEENYILKTKVEKVDLLLKTIGELQKTY